MIPLPPRPTWEGAAIFIIVLTSALSVMGILGLAVLGVIHLVKG